MKFRWRIGETFRLPFFKRPAYLTIKFDEGLFSFPPDWMERANAMLLGKLPADANFLARAWYMTLMQRNEMAMRYQKEIRLLERKIQAQKSELRRLGGMKRPDSVHTVGSDV